MTKKFYCIFMILTFLHNTCFCEMISTDNINDVLSIFDSADQETLVIFDVDDVLIMPQDQILQSAYRSYLHQLDDLLPKEEEEFSLLWSIIFTDHTSLIVDKKIVDLIKKLQSKHIRVLALTHCMSGKFGNIRSMEEWRYCELIHSGYDFQKSWRKIKNKTLNLENNSQTSPSTFFNGIIFTQIDKGLALESFLNDLDLVFTKIIFIDDKKSNLESVSQLSLKSHIAFIGVHYEGAKKHTIYPLDKERASHQFEILKKEKRWVSDSEADKILQVKKQ